MGQPDAHRDAGGRAGGRGPPNREIAAKLFVSVATVRTHLVHVYGKLDVPTRAELAAAATSRSMARARGTPEHNRDHRGGDESWPNTSKKNGSKVVTTLRYRDAPAAISGCAGHSIREARRVSGGRRHDRARPARLRERHGHAVIGARRRLRQDGQDAGRRGRRGDRRRVRHRRRRRRAPCPRRGRRRPITDPPRDRDYGGRGYGCRDLEGYVWSFGSYDPWA